MNFTEDQYRFLTNLIGALDPTRFGTDSEDVEKTLSEVPEKPEDVKLFQDLGLIRIDSSNTLHIDDLTSFWDYEAEVIIKRYGIQGALLELYGAASAYDRGDNYDPWVYETFKAVVAKVKT